MRKRSLLLLTGLFVLVASLVIGPSATATSEGCSAGTVVIVHDQEPGLLNNFISAGNGYTIALVMNLILAGRRDLQQQGAAEAGTSSRPFPEAPPEGAAEGDHDVQEDRQME